MHACMEKRILDIPYTHDFVCYPLLASRVLHVRVRKCSSSTHLHFNKEYYTTQLRWEHRHEHIRPLQYEDTCNQSIVSY
jgi:hypothetical protein